jgi:hypothetical protein
MQASKIPFNIELLQLSQKNTSTMRPVKSLDVFVSSTKNFHPDGLYSTETFGIMGSDARFTRFGYIDLKINIIHPTIYNALVQLKALYSDIISSREFAVWDELSKDFIKSNALEGQTGYEFFINHFHEIIFSPRPSVQREQNILLIAKYKEKALLDKVLVLPAAFRDIEIDDFGRESSDEINSLYYKLVAISNTINPATVKVSPEAYNSQRNSLQNTFNEIYQSLSSIIEGKKNLLMGKWASRKVFNGTRNVITSMDTSSSHLGVSSNIGFNDTAVGLYQCMKAMLPITKYQLKNGFLSKVFIGVASPSLLTNKDTLMSERVNLKAEIFNQWMTNEGLDNLITNFKEPSIRDEPVKINGYYLGLMYKGPDGTFKLIHGIDELPEGRNKEDCKPITYGQLFYCSIYHVANNYPGYVTRYPVTGSGSIYVSKVFLKSTIKSETRKELGDDWSLLGEDKIAYQFPTDSDYFNSLSPNPSRLMNLGADFDGDTASFNIAYSDEAMDEAKKFFNSKIGYVASDGKFLSNVETDTIRYVLHNLTG